MIHPRAGQQRQLGSAGAGPATAYVLSVSALAGGSGKVTPVLTATSKTLRPIVAKGAPAAIAITPDGKTAYIACSSGFGGQGRAGSVGYGRLADVAGTGAVGRTAPCDYG